MPSVEIVSLSVNNISTLIHFRHCPNLKELYLRKNAICSLNEVRCTAELPLTVIACRYAISRTCQT